MTQILEPEREQEAVKRRQIIQAVVECVSEEGIEGATIRRVAERLGVSTGMVTYYYPSKRALIDATIAAANRDIAARVNELVGPAYGRERLEKVAELLLTKAGDSFPAVSFWLEFWAAATREEPLRQRFLDALQRNHEHYRRSLRMAIERGRLRAGLDEGLAADLISALLRGLRIESRLGAEHLPSERALAVFRLALGLLFEGKTTSAMPAPRPRRYRRRQVAESSG